MPSYVLDFATDGTWYLGDPVELPDDAAASGQAIRAVAELIAATTPEATHRLLEVFVRRSTGEKVLTVSLDLQARWHKGAPS
jgi:hypothetical protein